MYYYKTAGNTLTSTDVGGTIKGEGKVLYESGVSNYNLGPDENKEDFAVNLCANFNGAIYCNSAIYVGCDERNKHKITEINDSTALDILRNINVYTFYYNDVLNKPHNLHYNVLAQEVEKILPQAISKEKGFLANIMKQVKVEFIAIENNEFKMIVETEIEDGLVHTLNLVVKANVKFHIMQDIVNMLKDNTIIIEDTWVTSEDTGDTEEIEDIEESL